MPPNRGPSADTKNMRKRPILLAFVALGAAAVLCCVLEVIIVELSRDSAGSIQTRLSRDLPEGTSEQTINEYLARKGMPQGSYVFKYGDRDLGLVEKVHVPANTKIIVSSVTHRAVLPMYDKEVMEITFVLGLNGRLTHIYVEAHYPDAL